MNDWLKVEIFTSCLLATLLGAGAIAAFCFWLVNKDKQEIEETNFKDYVKETLHHVKETLHHIKENTVDKAWKNTDENMTEEDEEEEDKYVSSVLNQIHDDDTYKDLLSQEEINKLHEI
jgi:predicted dinucleotide-utilizing enzyme